MASLARLPMQKVLVSFDEEWDLARYLDRYLATRRLVAREHVLDQILECLGRYRGSAPYRKTDLDYFLDANYARSR